MARRRLLGDEQWAALFALPAGERDVVRHCTLTPDDLALVAAKRSAPNRLGYALLLCALRHPGRALEPGERPPAPMVAFVARQLGIDPAVLATGPDRPQTRREQLVELMRRGGFQGFGRAEARDLVTWLTPVTQANRKPGQLAGLLVEELRRRRILLPTPRVLELVIHHARIRAERALHRALIDGMGPVQLAALDELLAVPADSAGPSPIAWLRQPPGSPAARNLVGLVERVRTVRAIGLDRNREAAVPPAAFDALAGEGLRMTAQHLRDLAQPRRAATVAATVLRLDTELTDAALLMFDKLMGGLSRRAERKAVDNAAAALRDAQRHLRLLARAGRALIAAREDGTDAAEAVESAVGWGPFLRAVAEAEQIARPETVDVRAELVQRWPAMRQFAPALLEAFAFEGAASAFRPAQGRVAAAGHEPGRQAHPARQCATRLHPPRLASLCGGHGRQGGPPGLGGVRAVRAARPAAGRRRVGAGQPALPQLRGLPIAQADLRGPARRGTAAGRGGGETWNVTSPPGATRSRRRWRTSLSWPRPASCPTPCWTRPACASRR